MPLMRRRPLLRAAAIGGGAYYAGKKRQRGPAARVRRAGADRRARGPAAGCRTAAAPLRRPRAGSRPDTMAQLEQLGKLHNDGVLTDEEFATPKAKLLG